MRIFEETWRSLIENAPNIIIIIDRKEKIQYVNRTLSGINPKDMIGNDLFDYIQPEYCEMVKKIIRKVFKTGEHGSYEVRAVTSSGMISWYETKVGPIKQGEQINAVALFSTDISERKKAEQKLKESEEQFRLFAEQSQMGIVLLQDDIMKYVNRAMSEINEYSIEEMMKWTPMDYFEITYPEDRLAVMKRFKTMQTEGKPSSLICRFITKYGKIKWVETYGKTIIYNGKPAAFGSVIDITDKKEAEQKLKESEKKYREAYNRAEFYKDLFAHDINNILQNVLSASELSKLYLDKPENKEKILDSFNIINQQVNRGAKLISNVRKLSKLEEQKPEIFKIEIMNLLRNSIEFIKNSYQNKIIAFQVDAFNEKVYIQANNLIQEVFENILINSVKYNKNPTVEIIVKIAKEEREGVSYLKLEFIDNGIGIDDNRKIKIFQRTETDSKSVSGMGLGLSLVKKIIESYNGKIWIEDKVKGDHSKGSKFIILIPEAI